MKVTVKREVPIVPEVVGITVELTIKEVHHLITFLDASAAPGHVGYGTPEFLLRQLRGSLE